MKQRDEVWLAGVVGFGLGVLIALILGLYLGSKINETGIGVLQEMVEELKNDNAMLVAIAETRRLHLEGIQDELALCRQESTPTCSDTLVDEIGYIESYLEYIADHMCCYCEQAPTPTPTPTATWQWIPSPTPTDRPPRRNTATPVPTDPPATSTPVEPGVTPEPTATEQPPDPTPTPFCKTLDDGRVICR